MYKVSVCDIRRTLCVAGVGVRKMMRSVSFYVLIFYTLLFWYLYDWNIKSLAADYGYGVTPYLMPLFYADDVFRLYGLLLIVLVTCGAPFLDKAGLFTIHRTGRLSWGIGQMIYIVLANLIFQVVMFLAQIITLLPYVVFSGEWGGVLFTVANSPDMISSYNGFGSFSSKVILGMRPLEAMGKEIVLCVLLGSVIGVVIFLVNGLLRRGIGAILAVVGAVLTGYLTTVDLFWSTNFCKYFPFLWIDLEYYLDGTCDFGTNVGILSVLFLTLAAVACMCAKKGWIQTTE